MADFCHVLHIDETRGVLEVEGGTTYEEIVGATIRRHLLPTVAPELKDITVGGAIVGIGIESSCFRYGFVHDGATEIDVLLPDGDIVTCTRHNEFSDLFSALPNSYGTLGYILRATIRLVPARPYVHLMIERMSSIRAYLEGLKRATTNAANDFVEGLMFSASELYVIAGGFANTASRTADIYGLTPYYEQLRRANEMWLRTEDYIFRYDPDWFWNVPQGGIYSVFRLLAPRFIRHSSFYKRYTHWKVRVTNSYAPVSASRHSSEEPVIQDWQVPWDCAEDMTQLALTRVDLQGKPWASVPITPLQAPTLYPIRPNCLYFNLGCYCWARAAQGEERFHNTKTLDRRCFELGGIKMLYSSTFLTEDEFNLRFNGDAYQALKRKYDPGKRLPSLFEKVANAVNS
jgi:FAD/FMN-containing dehydrogenase